jgi:hypothetical protein
MSGFGAVSLVFACSSEKVDSASSAALVSPDLVISQVYGGGGNSGAPYTNDFVELFNRGSSAVQLQGYSIQYASDTGNFQNNTNYVDLPAYSLQPGQYFLVQLASGGAGGVALPSPDAIGNISMGSTAGKVAITVTNTKLNACGNAMTPCNASDWIDLVGYGSSATQYEGTGPAAAPSNTKADFRASSGCIDTGDNKADFATAAPAPRNTSTTSSCSSDAGPDVIDASDADTDVIDASDAAGDATDASSDSASDAGAADGGPLPLLVISQVYGGGGNSGAPYTNDFVEVFNRSGAPVQLQGYSLQYASAASTFQGSTNSLDLPSFVLQPGQYFLVQLASGGASGQALPTPDATGTINLGSTAGKIALVPTAQKLSGCGTMNAPCSTGAVLDLVGFGSTAEQYEGSGPAPAPSNTKSDVRAADGCIDTDDNANDFSVGAPNPRNSTNFTSCAGDGGATDGGLDATASDASTDGQTTSDASMMDGSPADGSSDGSVVAFDAATDAAPEAGLMGEVSGGCSCAEAAASVDRGSALVLFASLLVWRGRPRRRWISGSRPPSACR